MAIRLSTCLAPANIKASHGCPSCNSPSPVRTYIKCSSRLFFLANAAPIAMETPCPNDPEDTLIPDKCFDAVGCPCKREEICRNVANSSIGKNPLRAITL